MSDQKTIEVMANLLEKHYKRLQTQLETLTMNLSFGGCNCPYCNVNIDIYVSNCPFCFSEITSYRLGLEKRKDKILNELIELEQQYPALILNRYEIKNKEV